MSKTAVALKKHDSETSDSRIPIAANRKFVAAAYSELIRRLFYSRSAVAVVASGTTAASIAVCEGIAGELAGTGKSAVIVRVDALLRLNSMPPAETAACLPGRVTNVWLWPSSGGAPVDSVAPSAFPLMGKNWLDSLRRIFDSVVLDCPGVDAVPAAIDIATLADAAVLVVEAGRTSKQQIRRDQHVLQSGGLKLAGCVLVGPRQSK